MPVTLVENGSKTVATTDDRLPRMRYIVRRFCINQERGRNGVVLDLWNNAPACRQPSTTL
ncbi:MAG: hypothetical protein VB140_08210 [Burkholderia sp.]